MLLCANFSKNSYQSKRWADTLYQTDINKLVQEFVLFVSLIYCSFDNVILRDVIVLGVPEII